MTKRLKLRAALSLLLVLFTVSSVWAEKQYISGGSGPMWEYDSSTRTLTISGKGDMPDFTGTNTVPWFMYQHTKIVVESGITSIGNYSFQQYYRTVSSGLSSSQVTSVTLPEGITKIGDYAFCNLNVLETINIPSSVTSIGSQAFYGCKKLTSLTLPAGLQTIGTNAFYRCSGLSSISVEPNNTKYDSRNNCNAIIETASNTIIYGCMNTIIPNTVTTIGDYAFEFSGIESITIPGNVQSIGQHAFYGCDLKTVAIENGVKVIGDAAFADCSDLLPFVIPNSVETIGSSAFSYCTSLTSINIPNSVTTIGTQAFTGCSNLMSITLPDNLQSISYTFYQCSNLKSITLPATLQSITQAFSYCTSLDVYCYANPDNLSWSTTSSEFKPNYATKFHVAANTKAKWREKFPSANVTFIGDLENIEKLEYAVGGNNSVEINVNNSDKSAVTGEIVIPSTYTDGTNSYDVTTIANNAFADCSNLTSVSIPSTITSIGSGAFEGCSSLNNIVVDSNNPNYDSREGCNAIIETASNSLISGCKNTVIPSSVTSIASKAFSGCVDLSSINIPSNVTSIGESAFKGCTALTSASLPSSLTSIAKEAFKGTGLTGISIPSNVTSIGESAFANCAALATASLPSGLTSIAKGAFKGTGLTTIEIPYSVKSVGESSFEGCSGLKSVTLPTDLAMIAKNTFLNCSSMTTVNIPVAVTKIEEGAFKNCDKLVAVTLPSGLVELGMSVFENSGLESITLPPEVTAIAQKAFYSCRNLVSATLYAPQLTSYADDAFDDNATNRKISVLSDYVDTYKSNWSKYSNDIVPISLTLNANPKNTTEKWCTYYNAVANVTVPAGVTIYKAQLDQANAKVLLSEVGGSIIAKGNAVMLKGSTSSINLSSAASAGSGDYTGNDLKGGTATPSTVAYTLAGINGVMGFYQYTGESLDPNKAHLEVAASGARSFIGFDSGTSTDVKLQTEADDSDQEWYTIDGRKLKGQPTQKGIYVKNGKKHVVK